MREAGDRVTRSLERLIDHHAPAPLRPPFSIGVQRLKDGLKPVIVSGCLWDAVRLMAWLDRTAGRQIWVPCRNERCRGGEGPRFFQRTRPDKLYCSAACSRQATQRKYWHAEEGGAHKRRELRERLKKSKEPPVNHMQES
jgi:hypothetical protein